MQSISHILVLGVVLFLVPFGWSRQTNSTTSDSTNKDTQSDQTTSDTGQQDTNANPEKTTKPAKFGKPDSKAEPDIAKRLDNSASVLQEIMGTPDKGIPTKILSDAKCIIVIPSMINIAIGIGGRHGKGVSTCRTTNSGLNGWSAPAPVTLTGGSWGLQLGGQAVDLVMLVMNQKGMDHLLSSKFKIGAEATGAAGPIGRDVASDTDWKLKAEILSYSRARGLFAGIDLNGASIKQDRDETAVLYGKILPFEDILSGKVEPPSSSRTFLATVHKYSDVAQEKKEGE
jgi:SH3 domain-containing YSC84-like protein 1